MTEVLSVNYSDKRKTTHWLSAQVHHTICVVYVTFVSETYEDPESSTHCNLRKHNQIENTHSLDTTTQLRCSIYSAVIYSMLTIY